MSYYYTIDLVSRMCSVY